MLKNSSFHNDFVPFQNKCGYSLIIKAFYVMLVHFYDFNFLMRCPLPRSSTHKYCIYPRMTELAFHCRFLSVL